MVASKKPSTFADVFLKGSQSSKCDSLFTLLSGSASEISQISPKSLFSALSLCNSSKSEADFVFSLLERINVAQSRSAFVEMGPVFFTALSILKELTINLQLVRKFIFLFFYL